MTDKPVSIESVAAPIAAKLGASVRAEDGIYHLDVPVRFDEDDDGGEPDVTITVTLTLSEDRDTIFATRYLCTYDDTIDLVELLHEVGTTTYVQLALDDEQDLILSGTAPVNAPPEW